MERLGEPVAARPGRRGVCTCVTRAHRWLRQRRAFACDMNISVCRVDQTEARTVLARRARPSLAQDELSALDLAFAPGCDDLHRLTVQAAASNRHSLTSHEKWRLTFDMSGGPKGAKRPLERPLDGTVRRARCG